MPQYPLRLPQDLYNRAQALAEAEGVSMNQLLLYAVADLVSELESRRFFVERGKGVTKEEALRGVAGFLKQVPDVEADPDDRMSPRSDAVPKRIRSTSSKAKR